MRLRIKLAICAVALACCPAVAAPQYASDGISIMREEPGTVRKSPRKPKAKPALRSQNTPSATTADGDETRPARRRTTVYPYVPPPKIDPRQGIVTPRTSGSVGQTFSEPPPPVIVPGTARAIPNLPSPGGRAETSQDRSVRCTHQAGLNSVPGEQRGAYISTCIGQ